MPVSDIVQQPNLRMIGASKDDVVRYAWRVMHANINEKEKRIFVKKYEGVWYARAYQGHSAEMGATLGPDFAPGRLLAPNEYEYIYHGTFASKAAHIREKGVLRGGVSAHRLHIHLTTCVRDRRENGVPMQGVKGDIYVQIRTADLVEYHHDGEPVKLWINEKGVILTPGAGGAQPGGREAIRVECIPAELCQTIRYVKDGSPVETEEDQARAIQLRSVPPERRRPRPRRRERLEPVPEEAEEEQ